MSNNVQDTIERHLVIKAPIERVYQGIFDDFLKNIEGDIVSDSHVVFNFGEYGKSSAHFIRVEPVHYVSYRWVPGKIFEGDIYAEGCTLVEFKLAETEEGTSLTLIESGFASLPPERYSEAMEMNTAGWDEELANIVTHLTG